MLNRATATLNVQSVGNLDGTCVDMEVGGTGVLSSDTRMTTAFHVVHPWRENVRAYFESRSNYNSSTLKFDLVTGLIARDNEDSQYNWEETRTFRSDADEENPLLANRLFTLGLAPWAVKMSGSDERDALRENWRFDADAVDPNTPAYAAGTWWSQGFLQISSNEYAGRDIAVLKAKPNTIAETNSAELISGAFKVDRPAVFFGKVQYNSFYEHGPQHDQEFIVGTYTARWPDAGDPWVPLIALPGKYGSELDSQESFICGSSGQPPSVNLVRTSIFSTSHDSIGGSSGGALLSPHQRNAEGTPLMRALVGTGVLAGARFPEDEKRDHVTWGKPVGSEEVTEHYYTAWTQLVDGDPAMTNRDPSTSDPHFPTPIMIGDIPECVELSENSAGEPVCLAWKTVGPVEPETAPGDDPFPIPAPSGTTFETDDEENERVGSFPRSIICRHDDLMPAVMIGIHGALAFGGANPTKSPSEVVQQEGGIGSFLAICAPYSAVSYTSNWRFVTVRGAQLDRGLDTLGGQWGWGTFDEYMARVYEERSVEGKIMVRPPSAKTCPPNYLLQGIGLSKHENGTHYTGVTHLECAKPPSSPASGPDTLPVFLNPENEEGTFDYTLAGKPFSLKQLIGYPSCAPACSSFECPPGYVMHGFRSIHDVQGRLTHFTPICSVSP